MRQKISDIYVPIDYSDLKSIIPPGEDIIYSTLCKGIASVPHKYDARKKIITKWATHILITPNGIAWNKPNYYTKKQPSTQEYTNLEFIDRFFRMKVVGSGFSFYPADLKVVRDENYESKEKFKERSRKFVSTIAPYAIERKKKWLAENQDNPEIKKRLIKKITKTLRKSENLLNTILTKDERKAAKNN
ncbi:MAG: hypothetical protein ACFFE5_04285 [Candidatus Thorarchaeota archaeon]